MMITSQCATNQWNEKGEAVSYWCDKRGVWITHKKFRKFYPFTTDFCQPYKDKTEHQELNPRWQQEREEAIKNRSW